MSLFKKSDSPFWWYDLRVAGKRHRGSTRQSVKAKAQQIEAGVVQKLMVGTHTTIHNKPPYLADFAPRFLAFVEGGRLREKTKLYYRAGWRLLCTQTVAGTRMDAITTSLAVSITAPGGPSNVNCALRTLHRMLAVAVDWGILHRVPRIGLARERIRERMIAPGEESMILGKGNRTLRAVVILIMDTGMRPSEAASLRWDDVDFLAGVVLIVDGKTPNARRHLPMTRRVRDMLAERAGNGSAWVFPRRGRVRGQPATDLPMRGRTFSAAFSVFKRKQGLPKEVVLYSARHTFATDLLAFTGNTAHLKKVMGHSSLGTTERYLHPNTADLGTIMDLRNHGRIERAYDGATIQ